MSLFKRYIGIDYSGAQASITSLPGLRVYTAQREPFLVEEIPPPPSPRKYWSRKEIALWLEMILAENTPTLVGIDHGFSFPARYFEKYGLSSWDDFLVDFKEHWPSDGDRVYLEFIRAGLIGRGAERRGLSRWRRRTEERCGAKSVFHFDVPGSVAKSTHAGLPWVLYLRQRLPDRLHFWPFDGWVPPPDKSVIAEAYPRLWSSRYPVEDRTPDQHDAYSLARGFRDADRLGELHALFKPNLSEADIKLARLEGWILGVSE